MRFKQSAEGHWVPAESDITVGIAEKPQALKQEPKAGEKAKDGYESMTDDQLAAFAEEKELDLGKFKTRTQLVKALEKVK